MGKLKGRILLTICMLSLVFYLVLPERVCGEDLENPMITKGSTGWLYTPLYPSTPPPLDSDSKTWYEEDYDDSEWIEGKAPFGYGDEPRAKYETKLENNNGSYFFRKFLLIKDAKQVKKLILRIASDNAAIVYINGIEIDRDPFFGKGGGHEFAYWNREIKFDSTVLEKGRNIVAVHLYNNPGSSDAYFDFELLGLSSEGIIAYEKIFAPKKVRGPPFASGGKFTFAVMGDNRPIDAEHSQQEVFKKIIQDINILSPSFSINTGDLVFSGEEKQYQEFLGVMEQLNQPWYTVAGNHEIHGSSILEVRYQTLIGPLYHSFDYKNSHFVFLDTEVVGEKARIIKNQLRWLKSDLQKTDKDHIFVFFHRPLYSAGRRGRCLDKYPEARDRLASILKQYKVDIIFAGHEHLYNYREVNGLRQLITGGAGAPLHAKKEKGGFHHYILVEVDKDKVILKCMKPGKEVVDSISFSNKSQPGAASSEQKVAPLPLRAVSYPAEYERSDQFYMVKGELGHLLFYFEGDKTAIKEPQIIIDLPETLKFCHAFYRDYDIPGIPLTSGMLRKDLKRKGKYIRHIIPLQDMLKSRRFRAKMIYGSSALIVFLEYNPEIPDHHQPIYWHLSNNKTASEEKRIEVNILSPLVENHPKRMKFYIWDTCLLASPDERYREILLNLYKKLGIRGGMGRRSKKRLKVDNWLLKRGWEVYVDPGSWGGWRRGFWGIYDFQKLSEETQDVLVTLRNGQKTKDPRLICQTFMIENGKEGNIYFEEAKKHIAGSYFKGMTGFVNDYEMNWTNDQCSPQNSCFCPRCLKAFSEFAEIRAEKLSPDEILSRYRKEWYDFRYWQNAKMMKIFHGIVKSIDPELKSVVCSTSVRENREDYPIDIRLYDQWVDEHWPMAYYNGPALHPVIERTVGSLKTPVIPVLNTCYPIGEHKPFSGNDVRLNTLAAAASGCKGICYFTGSISLDGDYVKAIDKAGNEIAILEDFFLEGERAENLVKVEGLPEKEIKIEVKGKWEILKSPDWNGILFHKVHKLKDKLLISLFNYHSDKEAYVSIKLIRADKDKYLIYDPINRMCISKSPVQSKEWTKKELVKGIVCKIPSREVRFLIIEEYNPSLEFKGVISEKDIEEEYRILKGGNKIVESKEISKNSLRIGWEDVDGDGLMEILLESPLQKVWVSPKYGGRVWEWKINKSKRSIVHRHFNETDKGGLCVDFFWKPKIAHDKGTQDELYNIINREITLGEARVVMGKRYLKNPLRGLVLQKTYIIPKDKTYLEVNYSLSNEGTEPISFSFWSHNFPILGEKETKAKGLILSKGINLVVPVSGGVEEREGREEKAHDVVYNAPFLSINEPGLWESPHEITKGWFAEHCPLSQEMLVCELDLDKLLQIYWCRVEPPTFEWMYKLSNLKPGESWQTSFKLIYLQGKERARYLQQNESVSKRK